MTQYRDGGGDGPRYGQVRICWAETEDEAKQTVFRLWRHSGLGGTINQELPRPSDFDAVAESVTIEMAIEGVPCGPDPAPVLEQMRTWEQAGFDRIAIHQVGPDQAASSASGSRSSNPSSAERGADTSLQTRDEATQQSPLARRSRYQLPAGRRRGRGRCRRGRRRITGATAAYLLKRAGKSVALLESDRICAGATGYTTAKLTVGHSLVYRELIDSFGVETARRYASSNQQAIESVADIVKEHGLDCDFERASNYVYTETSASTHEIEREVDAARRAGLDAQLTTETDLPYPVAAAIRVDQQAQFHPWKYVAALAALVRRRRQPRFEQTRATGVQAGDPCTVETARGVSAPAHVVIATQLPFTDRGLFFAKAHPIKSYAIAARSGKSRPREACTSASITRRGQYGRPKETMAGS